MIYYNSRSLDCIVAVVKTEMRYKGQKMPHTICMSNNELIRKSIDDDCVYESYCRDGSDECIINDENVSYITSMILDCLYGYDISGFFKLKSLYANIFRSKCKEGIIF